MKTLALALLLIVTAGLAAAEPAHPAAANPGWSSASPAEAAATAPTGSSAPAGETAPPPAAPPPPAAAGAVPVATAEAAAVTAVAPKSSLSNRLFFGGGVGFSFGDVEYYEISPIIGLRLAPRVTTGLSLTYRHVTDKRYNEDITTNTYGAAVFAQWVLFRNLFAEGKYQYLSYDVPTGNGGTSRYNYDSFLAGGGYLVPLGGKGAAFMSALYDFSYDSNDVYTPYSDPWVFEAGVTFGF
jgi:hypothetical protein